MASNSYDLSVVLRVLDKATAPLQSISQKFKQMIVPVNAVTDRVLVLGRTFQTIKEKITRPITLQIIDKASARLKEIARKLSDLKERAKEANKNMRELGETVKKAGEKIGAVGRGMAWKLTLPLVLMGGTATKTAIDFESAFAGVRKTVEATEEELAVLNKQLMAMALRKPLDTKDIFRVAELAGQLGIATNDIVSFSGVMADLAVTTDIASEDAAMLIAQFASFTNMPIKNVDRLASTIVGLGNESATTESKIVNMMFRIGAGARQVGLSHDQIVALAASLASAGIEAEMGGTAFSKMLRDITTAVAKGGNLLNIYAVASGKSAKQFAEDWKKKPLEAIYDLLEGFSTFEDRAKKAGMPVQDLTLLLDALKLDAGRMADVITRSANSIDKFRESGGYANKFWKENIALTEEANKRYATTASRLIIVKNHIAHLANAFGKILKWALVSVAEFFIPFIVWLKELSPAMKIAIIIIGALVAIMGPLLMFFAPIISAIGSLITAMAILSAVGAPAITALAAPFLALLIPIAAVTAAIVGIGAAIIQVVRYWDDLKRETKAMWSEFTTPTNAFAEAGKRLSRGAAFEQAKQLAAGRAMASEGGLNKSETDINIKVTSDQGSTATIEKIKPKKGDAKVNIATVGYVGAYH